jgi:hypothetical protein
VSNGEPFRLLIKSPVDFVVYKGIRATPQEEERPQIPKLTNSLLNQRLINKIKINPPPAIALKFANNTTISCCYQLPLLANTDHLTQL